MAMETVWRDNPSASASSLLDGSCVPPGSCPSKTSLRTTWYRCACKAWAADRSKLLWITSKAIWPACFDIVSTYSRFIKSGPIATMKLALYAVFVIQQDIKAGPESRRRRWRFT
jgi:hypothetical protein